MKVLVLELSVSRFEQLMTDHAIQILGRKRSYKNRIFDVDCDAKALRKLVLANNLEVGVKIL